MEKLLFCPFKILGFEFIGCGDESCLDLSTILSKKKKQESERFFTSIPFVLLITSLSTQSLPNFLFS